jgi:GNAT superfamily N-acetyltransferase
MPNNQKVTLDQIHIRSKLQPGDIGTLTWLHGLLYSNEYNHGIAFEAYVAQGLAEFFQNHDPKKDCIWICEHDKTIIGSLFMQHRKEGAQLRYFLIHPEFRGIGLGKKLMQLYMNFILKHGYEYSFLWTTSELHAASTLYKRHGFVLAEEKKSTRFGKPLTEQMYEWKFQKDRGQ